MKKALINRPSIWLIYILGMMVVVAMFFPGCTGPNISVKSNTGFIHETSVRVPFKPGDSVDLYIDDEGNAIFIKHIEIHHGKVSPEKEYWFEIYKADKSGIVETEKFGPFVAWQAAQEGDFIIAADETDTVTCIDLDSLNSTTAENRLLAVILKAFPSDYFSDRIVTHTVPLSSKIGVERWLAIYDIENQEEVTVDLREEYASIDAIDFDGEDILVKASKGNREPPVLYVLGLDGTHKLKLDLLDQLGCARLIPGGIAVYMTDVLVVDTDNANSQISRSSLLKKYQFNGTVEWSQSIPLNGVPLLKLSPGQDDGVLALTLINRNEMTSFIGYFSDEDGERVYTNTFQGEYSIWPLDDLGSYYIYPEWSLYPEIPPPSGRIALFNHGNELASVESDDDIYYFATSPSGRFFAVVSDGTLSIFSTAGDGHKEK